MPVPRQFPSWHGALLGVATLVAGGSVPSSAAAQHVGDCLRVAYRPDSLQGYLPSHLRLDARRVESATSKRGRLARWWPAAHTGNAYAAWRQLHGFSVWRRVTRPDSLVIEFGEPYDGAPYGVVRLTSAGWRRWQGTASYLAGEAEPPVRVRAEAEQTACDARPPAG